MSAGFCQAVGQWQGTAEVYDGRGVFLGNGVDQRHVSTDIGDGRVRIGLSFTGPFKFAGHYVIADKGSHRLYEGPINVGFAESLGENGVQADNYWAVIGMSQRFFLMVLPGEQKQLSLALLSRGERLMYAVVGENDKQTACATDDAEVAIPGFVSGASVDLAGDPAAGRGTVLLHRPGRWHGTMTTLDSGLEERGQSPFEQLVERDDERLRVRTVGGLISPEPYTVELATDGWQAWTGAGDVVGSYSLSGGRALSGQFHRLSQTVRVWRREVVSHDGTVKAVVNNWYRGGERIAVEHGVLTFEGA